MSACVRVTLPAGGRERRARRGSPRGEGFGSRHVRQASALSSACPTLAVPWDGIPRVAPFQRGRSSLTRRDSSARAYPRSCARGLLCFRARRRLARDTSRCAAARRTWRPPRRVVSLAACVTAWSVPKLAWLFSTSRRAPRLWIVSCFLPPPRLGCVDFAFYRIRRGILPAGPPVRRRRAPPTRRSPVFSRWISESCDLVHRVCRGSTRLAAARERAA